MEIAVATECNSVRIYRIQGCPTCLHDKMLFIECCGANKPLEDGPGLGIEGLPLRRFGG